MKIFCELIDKKLIDKNLNIDCFIIGIKSFSFNIQKEFSSQKINDIIYAVKNKGYQCAINLEKIFHEEYINKINELIKKVDMDKVDYIFYSDFGIYQILKEKGYQNKLIYHSTTMITNSEDIKYLLNENNNIVLGKELSINEIKNIDHLVNKKIMLDAFGVYPIFYSKRKLLTNYFNYRKLNNNPHSLNYSIKEEYRDEHYRIIEKDGTIVYEKAYYALTSEIKQLKNIDSILVLGMFLKPKQYINIIKLYIELINNKDKNIDDKLNKIVEIYKGKLDEKTVLLKGALNE